MGRGHLGQWSALRRVLGIGICLAAVLALAGCGGPDLLHLPGLGSTASALNVTPKEQPPPREVTPGEAKAARARLGEVATIAAARSNPRDLEAVISAARIMRQQGDKAGALALLDTSAPVAPNDARLLRDRGLLALELGAIARARDHLKKAVANGSRDWQTRSALGTALAAAGDQKGAQREFAEALGQAPGNPVVLNNLALSMALEGRRSEAEQMLRQAAGQKKGSDARVAHNLALVSRISDQKAKAADKPAARAAEKQSAAPPATVPGGEKTAAAAARTRTAQVDASVAP
ncbi:MAG TPA: tetratricopeptide repeat protein [Hyphomicrobiaceae bacterium]|nr:tetratricopeptide repeat protein [Hyphomicrobiaceae bacterium]